MKIHYHFPSPTQTPSRRIVCRLLLLLTLLLGLGTANTYAVNFHQRGKPHQQPDLPHRHVLGEENYPADQTSTIVVFLLSAAPNYAYQGEGRVTVPAGSDLATVFVTVSGTAALGTGYGFYAKLRNMSGTEVASGSGGAVSVVTNPLKTNAISITNSPTSVAVTTAGNYYGITVNFTANQKGKVVVTLENEVFTVKGRGEHFRQGARRERRRESLRGWEGDGDRVRAGGSIATGTVTDGNGIIIDDFRNTQDTDPNCPRRPQPYLYTGKVLVFNNLTTTAVQASTPTRATTWTLCTT